MTIHRVYATVSLAKSSPLQSIGTVYEKWLTTRPYSKLSVFHPGAKKSHVKEKTVHGLCSTSCCLKRRAIPVCHQLRSFMLH